MTYYFKFDRLEYIEEYVFDNYVKVLISNYISIHRLPVRLVAGFKSVYAIEFNEIILNNTTGNHIEFISKDGNHLLVSFTRDLSNLIDVKVPHDFSGGEKQMTYYFKFDHYEDIKDFVVYSVFLNNKVVRINKIDDGCLDCYARKVEKVKNFKSIYQIDFTEFQTHFVKEMTIESFNSNKKITFKLYRSLDNLFNDYPSIYIGIRRSEDSPKRFNETNTTFINFILPDNYEAIVEDHSTYVNPRDHLEYVFYEVLLKIDRPEIDEVLKNETIHKSIFINYCGEYGYECSNRIGFMAFDKGVLNSEMNKHYMNSSIAVCENRSTSITQNFGESFKVSQELLNWFKDRNTKKYNDRVDTMRYALNIKKETTMTLNNISFVKNVKFNGPATIIFWSDETKTVVKCKDENYDAEKGLAMALAKGYTEKNARLLMRNIHIFNKGIEVVWANGTTTEMPWKDETHDIEKHIALAKIKKYGALVRGVKNTNWYDQFKELYKQYAPSKHDRILDKLTKRIQEILEPEKPIVSPGVGKLVYNTIDEINSNYIIEMFNAGASIKRISKETGLTEYFVKKFIDAATNPDVSKNKAARILNKAAKAAAKEKKPSGGHREKTIITCPKYLDEETGKRILEETKVKYAGRYKYDSDLNMYYIRECKLEYIKTHYNNGYSAYDIAKILGVSASGVMRIWNEYQRSINKGEE